MALDPRLLRSFVVLAEELHFGRAAELARTYEPQGHEILGAGTLYAVAPFAISAAVGLIAKNLDP